MIELSHDAMGAANRDGVEFDRDAELKAPSDWASAAKRTLEEAEKPPSGRPGRP